MKRLIFSIIIFTFFSHSYSQERKIITVNAQVEIDSSIEHLIAIFDDKESLHEWADHILASEIISKESQYEHISKVKLKFPLWLKDRLIYIRTIIKVIDDLVYIESQSIPYELNPNESSNFILGKVLISKTTLTRQNNKTIIKTENSFDPLGNIPVWLVNTISQSFAHRSIENILKRSKEVIYPDNVYFKYLSLIKNY